MSFRRATDRADKSAAITETRQFYASGLAGRERPTSRKKSVAIPPYSPPAIRLPPPVSVVDAVFAQMGIHTASHKRGINGELKPIDYFDPKVIQSVHNFQTCFTLRPVIDDNGIEVKDKDGNTIKKYFVGEQTPESKDTMTSKLNQALAKEKSLVGKFAGKNQMKDDKLLALATAWKDQAVHDFVGEAKNEWEHRRPVIVSEGDNYEENAPFSLAPSDVLKALKGHSITARTPCETDPMMIFVKKHDPKGYSIAFVDNWTTQIEKWGTCHVYFVETKPDPVDTLPHQERKSLLTFNADFVYFIAQTSHRDHMVKIKPENNDLLNYTAGYAHLLSLQSKYPTMTPRVDVLELERYPRVKVYGHKLIAGDLEQITNNQFNPSFGTDFYNYAFDARPSLRTPLAFVGCDYPFSLTFKSKTGQLKKVDITWINTRKHCTVANNYVMGQVHRAANPTNGERGITWHLVERVGYTYESPTHSHLSLRPFGQIVYNEKLDVYVWDLDEAVVMAVKSGHVLYSLKADVWLHANACHRCSS